jgi:anti-sigma factor RsiW
MKYMNLIERYLFGQLSPEEEVLFEKQLSRDPALAEETARRFRAGKTSLLSTLENNSDPNMAGVQDAGAGRHSAPVGAEKD